MSETRFAGFRRRAAADDRRDRSGVMRRPERRHGHERPAGWQQACDRVDSRHLERLVRRQARQDARKTLGQHGLADSRWSRKQEVVATRCGELERTLRALLPAHVREIPTRRLGPAPVRRLDRRRIPLTAEVRDGLGEVPNGDRLDSRQGGLGGTFGGADQLLEPAGPRALSRREHAADRPQAPVQPELADGRVLHDPLRRHLPRGGKDRERDRQVEARTLLSQLRGGEVDGDPPSRPLQLGGGDPAPHAVLRLLTGAVS